MKVSIVGAGPAGMYAADFLSKDSATRVEIYERLGEPYGLLRFGVSPDHAGTKAIARVFDRTLARPNVSLRCNAEVGRTVSMDDLLHDSDHLILATGAGSGMHAAHALHAPTEFAGVDFLRWMNGHPEAHLALPAGLRRVLVIGHGNVSLDVVRLLARNDLDPFGPVVSAAAAAWHRSLDLREIRVWGRGDAGQTRFSASGLQELAQLGGFEPVVRAADVAAAWDASNPDALAVLSQWTVQTHDAERTIRFDFGGTDIAPPDFAPDLVVHCIGQNIASVAGRMPADWAGESRAAGAARVHAVGWASGSRAGSIPDSRLQAKQLVEKIRSQWPA